MNPYQSKLPRLFTLKYMMACLIILLICYPLFLKNEYVGIYSSLLLIPFFILMVPSYIRLKERSIGAFAYITFTVISTQLSPVVFGPDSKSYYAPVLEFNSLGEFINNRIIIFNNDPLYFFKSVDVWFPNIYVPVFEILDISNEQSIIVMNIFFWILATFILIKLLREYSDDLWNAIPTNLYFFVLLLSPSFVYWSGTFLKDVISLSICIIAVYLLLKKKYFSFIFFCMVATGIRTWAIVIIGIYFLLIKGKYKFIFIGSITSIIIMLVYTKNIYTLINLPLVIGYSFLSPNPFSSNWGFVFTDTQYLFITPLTLEGIFIGIVLILSLPLLFMKEYRKKYLMILGAITIFATTFELVAYVYLKSLGETLGFAEFGDNLLRKKLPIMPMIYMWVIMTLKIYYNLYKNRSKKKKKEIHFPVEG